MDEAILIEIAQRFRKLEDTVEEADILALEKMLDACRDDMVSMQEAIRGRK